MATTTPNYGWDVPTSTDYVKDGATAIETLGDDIDASLYAINGGSAKTGLHFLQTVTVTSTSTFFVNNIFNANYDNYLIVIRLACAGNSALQMRLASGGTELIGTGYSHQRIAASGTTVSAANQTGAAQWDIGAVRNAPTIPTYGVFTIGNPFNASTTNFVHTEQEQLSGASIEINCGYNTSAVSYDGFRMFSSTAMTGSLKIYGYRNS
jgi:hypothetical protein